MSISLPPGQPSQPQGAKLTEEEQKAVTRLLSDPTYFPTEFRAWLKSYIESSGIILPASQITGGGLGDRTGLPAGIILPFPTLALPPDCIYCDGTAVVRSDFAKLFAIIGVTWGAGDGTSTFNIPDFRDRTLFCIGGNVTMAATDGVAFGSRGGANHHHDVGQTTNPAGGHYHNVDGGTSGDGDHAHNAPGDSFALSQGSVTGLGSGGSGRFLVSGTGGQTQGAGSHSHSVQGDTSDEPDHTHFLAGPTSGGFTKDRVSFAGVKYAITTGL